MIPDGLGGGSGSSRARTTMAMLVLMSVYAAALSAGFWLFAGLPTVVRLPLALPLILFVPGYALMAAVFPPIESSSGRTVVDDPFSSDSPGPNLAPLERGVLSVVTSIAVVPMVALLVNAVTGVRAAPILLGVAGLTVLASSVAIVRLLTSDSGKTGSPDEAAGVLTGTGWRNALSDGVTLVAIAITVVLLVSSVAVSFTGITTSGSSPTTEFYLTSGDGSGVSAAGGPNSTRGDGPRTYDLRVEHGADSRQQYSIVVMLDPSGGAGGSQAGSLEELDRFSTVVAPDETAVESYRVAPPEGEGTGTVLFLLYRGDAPSDPAPDSAHRTLRLTLGTAGE